MNLLIVESPTKAKHIQHFLDSGWQVKASLGHVRDLERSGDKSYVRSPEFKMNYAVTDDKHREIVAGLKAAAAKAEAVYIATDPDREGEAIAWHLCQVLGVKPSEARRVTYQEVTESAVKKAIANPRNLNMKLVGAQEVRRGLDRMVGWEVSGPLSNIVGTKASAGRVQTPALRLIVEREQAIKAFIPTPFFQVLAHMPNGWRAQWQDGMQAGEYFQDAAFAQALADAIPALPLLVTKSESKPTRKPPAPPFTTSSMQMDGARALKIGVDDIMKAAQALFEAGAITYHRTDSPNLSEEGETMLRETLESAGMPLVETPRRWKAKSDAQEAHEAIRPTNPGQIQAGEDAIQRALYHLIRKRALASQMPDAIYQQTSCTLDGGEFQGKPAIFKASGSVMTDPGWRSLYTESEDDDGQQPEAANPVPVLQEKTKIKAESGEVLSKTTKAPPRFTESTLIKALEAHGVGRPSTYASIIKVLFSRGYIHQKGKAPALYPTETGTAVIGALAGRFDFADLDWTRSVEDDLDGITAGSVNPRATLQKVWDSLQSGLGNLPAGAVPTTAPCPVQGCGGQVRRLQSQKKPGVFFWACSNREGHGLLADEKGQPGKTFEEKSEGIGPGPKCEDCDATTRILSTKTGKPYYRCPRCGEAWWTDKARNVLGKRWEMR